MSGAIRLLRIWAAAAAALLTALPSVAADAPKRVVSINVCADQLLLSFADPQQIASLSIFSTDAGLSYLAEKAKAFPNRASSAETVIGFHPDLVLAGRFTKLATREALKRLGHRVVELEAVRSVEDAVAQIRAVSALLGHPERGEALIADIEDARREAAAAATGARAPTVAVYQRRGYVTGGATLTGSLLGIAGFANQGGSLAGRTGGFVPLERLVASPPDFLILAEAAPRAEDVGTALLSHPALAALYPPARRIAVPDRLTVCAGPSLPEAIRHLAGEAARARTAALP